MQLQNREILSEGNAKNDLIVKLLHEGNAKDDLIVKLLLEAKERDEQILIIKRQSIEFQNQTHDNFANIQRGIKAILTQNFELHEYPIPRLFVILPVDQTNWNPLKILEKKLRLYFLCECGEHTVESSKSNQNHIHIAKHEGYEIRDPTVFYHKYGKYMIFLLQILQTGIEIADKSIPAVHAPKVFNQGIELTISYLNALKISNPILDNINTIANHEALEGPDLRELEKFLQINDGNRKFGNLYRIRVEKTGRVKWVCHDHYRSTYRREDQTIFEEVVEDNGGEYDHQAGRVTISLGSRTMAKEFFDSLVKARHVRIIDIELNWKCTKEDIELIKNSLDLSRVSTLRLDLHRFQPRVNCKLLSSPSARYRTIVGITQLRKLETVHMTLPKDLIKLSRLQPKKSPHHCNLSYEITPISMKAKKFLAFANSLKANKTLTILNFYNNSIGKEGAIAISEALKTNATLTQLNLSFNSIGDEGTIAISESLKINTTLTALHLNENSIGNEGAIVLSEALGINASLTTLYMRDNLIGERGCNSILEVQKSRKTLITLDLEGNAVRNDGTIELSKAQKDSTTLNLWDNSIENSGGFRKPLLPGPCFIWLEKIHSIIKPVRGPSAQSCSAGQSAQDVRVAG